MALDSAVLPSSRRHLRELCSQTPNGIRTAHLAFEKRILTLLPKAEYLRLCSRVHRPTAPGPPGLPAPETVHQRTERTATLVLVQPWNIVVVHASSPRERSRTPAMHDPATGKGRRQDKCGLTSTDMKTRRTRGGDGRESDGEGNIRQGEGMAIERSRARWRRWRETGSTKDILANEDENATLTEQATWFGCADECGDRRGPLRGRIAHQNLGEQ
ncbi:hypothetical protein B0H19DRAFT_1071297 [Mycena capillaripes]|nr:hypothetical protein B0H19DRAFT_1071297 [Mycena capillaripes]